MNTMSEESGRSSSSLSSSPTFGRSGGGRKILLLHCNVNKSLGSPAERLLFAEDKGEVAPDLCIRQRQSGQSVSENIFLNVGARNEAHAHICRDKALQQFARIEFHRVVRLEVRSE